MARGDAWVEDGGSREETQVRRTLASIQRDYGLRGDEERGGGEFNASSEAQAYTPAARHRDQRPGPQHENVPVYQPLAQPAGTGRSGIARKLLIVLAVVGTAGAAVVVLRPHHHSSSARAITPPALPQSAGTPAPAAASSNKPITLDAIILRSSQVGRGYVEHPYQQARTVQGQVTLDLCGFTFQSEALRTARYEVAYIRPGVELAISNEVVRYRAGGTQAAMQELATAADHCPTHPVRGPVAGVGPVTYRLSRIAAPRLLPGSLAFRVAVEGLVNGRTMHEIEYAIYQTKKDILSAVYAVAPLASASEARPLALHAAAQSARNLSSS